MSVLEEIIIELRAIERALGEQPILVRRIHKIAATLEGEQEQQFGRTAPWGWAGKLPWRPEKQYHN